MSVDFVARALAKQQQQQSGQGQSFTTLATGISGVEIPAGVKILQTSGYSTQGLGAGTYVNDSRATAGLAAAHPRFCKADAGGRYWRLLPDDQGLIPVACGGAAGTSTVPEVFDKPWQIARPADDPRGLFSGNECATSASGGNTVLTATGLGYFSHLFRQETGFRKVSFEVKAGTALHVFLVLIIPGGTYKIASFDLNAGTMLSDAIGNSSITALGGGYYRIEASAEVIQYGIAITDGATVDTPATVGSTVIIRRITVTQNATGDWPDARGIIQEAIDYSEAIDGMGTRYDAPNYALWRVPRTPSAPFDAHADKSGLLLQINKSHRFISSCGGTTLWRRDTDGSAMGKAKFDVCTGSGGYRWRGGGIWVEGQTTPPVNPSENSIYLYDIVLDGGVTDSSEMNNPYGPTMNSDGDGWDVSDKGIWQSNDRYCGHIELQGHSGVRYFMGELIYSSGIGNSVADRNMIIGPDVDMGHTCGSCINGNGITMKVDRCHLHDAFMGVEGWTGHLGGYFKPVISNCNRHSIQGGIPNFGSGSYYAKNRPVAAVVPMGYLDVLLQNAGDFEVGSWLYGRIEAIDCNPTLGNTAAFATGCQDVDLEIVTWADQAPPTAVVSLLGGGAGAMTTARVTLRVQAKRTDHAVANGYTFYSGVYAYGSFGPDVVIYGDVGISVAGAIYDNPIKMLGFHPNNNNFGGYYDMEANNNATVSLLDHPLSIAVTATNAGSYNVNLPTAGVTPGHRFTIWNFSTSVCRVPAGNFGGGTEAILATQPNSGGFGYMTLEFDGYRWQVVVPPPQFSASATYDPPSVAAGASATTTVALTGAVVGDRVSAGFSNSLQGMVLTGYVSAANTVTAVLFNPAGSAINLASGTLTVVIE